MTFHGVFVLLSKGLFINTKYSAGNNVIRAQLTYHAYTYAFQSTNFSLPHKYYSQMCMSMWNPYATLPFHVTVYNP